MMHKIENVQALEELRRAYHNALDMQEKKIIICAGTGCVAGGSLDIYYRLQRVMEERNIQ